MGAVWIEGSCSRAGVGCTWAAGGGGDPVDWPLPPHSLLCWGSAGSLKLALIKGLRLSECVWGGITGGEWCPPSEQDQRHDTPSGKRKLGQCRAPKCHYVAFHVCLCQQGASA